MTGSSNHDIEQLGGGSDSGGSSPDTHHGHPADDQKHQQQFNLPPGYNVADPNMPTQQTPLGYPGSEPQGQYEHTPSVQTRQANPNAPAWPQQGAPPAGAYPPPQPQTGYRPPSYSQSMQPKYPPPYQPHPQYPQQPQYGSPYNNPSAPTKAPPAFYPQGAPPSPMRPPPPIMGRGFGPVLRPDLPDPPGPWTSDIFGFLQDCNGCILTILAPCITFGQVAEIMDTGYNSCTTAAVIYGFAFLLGIPCLYSYTYRTKMRRHFNLRADPMDDLCLHIWCEICALSQEYRELRYRGIDPSLGYAMQRDTIAAAMDNPITPTMGVPDQMSMSK